LPVSISAFVRNGMNSRAAQGGANSSFSFDQRIGCPSAGHDSHARIHLMTPFAA
jgi:hypothetical protein